MMQIIDDDHHQSLTFVHVGKVKVVIMKIADDDTCWQGETLI